MPPKRKIEELTPVDLTNESITIRPSFALSAMLVAFAQEIEEEEIHKITKAEAVRRALAIFFTKHWVPKPKPAEDTKKKR